MTTYMFPRAQGTTRAYSKDEIAAFAARSGWVDDVAKIVPETTSIACLNLPWWGDAELIVANDPTWPGEEFTAAWVLSERLFRLDGSSPPIHAINGRIKPLINKDNVLSYLGFFCWYVCSERMPFAIVESVNDPIFPLQPGSEKFDAIEDLIRPAELLEEREDGFHCEAYVWYSDALFKANFVVPPGGVVAMIEDEPLVQETGANVRLRLEFSEPQDSENEMPDKDGNDA